MTSRFELQPLIQQGQTEKQQRDIARAVQNLIYLDTLRVGASEPEARSVADPDDANRVGVQLGNLLHPSVKNTRYEGVWEGGQLVAFVKHGPMFHGDLSPYRGEEPSLAQKVSERLRPDAGLHAFAVVRQELARVTLVHAVDMTPPKKKLYVVAHENDDWLNGALDEMEIPSDGPMVEKTIGAYSAQYQLRTIPPRT
jgi:hypothetical protein